MIFTIKQWKAGSFQVEVSSEATVHELKRNVAVTNPSLPAEQQKLVYMGKILKDDILLANLNIKSEHFIVLMLDRKPLHASADQSGESQNNVERVAVLVEQPPDVTTAFDVTFCKWACGRPVQPGKTSRGNPFDTCCRSCALSKGSGVHAPNCGGRATLAVNGRYGPHGMSVSVSCEDRSAARPEGCRSDESCDGLVPGTRVKVLNTTNAQEEFPEGCGKEFVIQECIDGGVYMVEGRYLVAGDLQLRERHVAPADYVTREGYGPQDLFGSACRDMLAADGEGNTDIEVGHSLGLGATVTILDTLNAQEEFPAGVGEHFTIQGCIGSGVYMVEGRYLTSDDLHHHIENDPELPIKMVGNWMIDTRFFQEVLYNRAIIKITSAKGVLLMDGIELLRDGPWMIFQFPSGSGHWRLKINGGGNMIVFQRKMKTDLTWEPPNLLYRVECLLAGAEMVVSGHCDRNSSILAKESSYVNPIPMGQAPAGTRVIAAGPPQPAVPSMPELVASARMPIEPHGHTIELGLGSLVLNEDLEDVLKLVGQSSMIANSFSHLGPIWNALGTSDTVLLHGKWLRSLADVGGVLPRRQDLPTAAVWELRHLKKQVELRRVAIASVSYCWLTWKHPDPKGRQIKTLSLALGLRLDDLQFPLDDMAIFIDFGSLYQKSRTPQEQQSFDRGLQNVTMWYASVEVVIFAMTNPPGDAIPYGLRGWPTFEWSVSSLQHASVTMLDLGCYDDTCTSWLALSKTCAGTLTPPTVPREFDNIIATKKFTNGRTDAEFVSRKYKKTFHEIAASMRNLNFARLNWELREILIIAEALTYFRNIQLLDLSKNRIQPTGAGPLALGLRSCQQLQSIYLARCELRDDGVKTLGPVFLDLPRMRELMLNGNFITSDGFFELFEVLTECQQFQRLAISNNPLPCQTHADCLAAMRGGLPSHKQRAFANRAAVAISRHRRLRALDLHDCCLDSISKQQLQLAWKMTRPDEGASNQLTL